ncbi:MAG: L-serine ammonia-lyase [Gammaproteobacteria bacterium]|nr:L-serine ammonia-lyase [Gammaproteobacteria bacterium]
MGISIFDIFKVGIGPSSSHTMGPMRAAERFVRNLDELDLHHRVHRVAVQLYGSLALTGKGHCTDTAVILGLEGELPDHIDPERVQERLALIRAQGRIMLGGRRAVAFDEVLDLLFLKDQLLPGHSNALRITAMDDRLEVLLAREYFSIGGGFIVESGKSEDVPLDAREHINFPYPFGSGQELLELCSRHQLPMHEIVRRNEREWRPDKEIDSELNRIWTAMQECVARGLRQEGVLPGSFKVRRRAAPMARHLEAAGMGEPLNAMEWVNVWALAVNEENASGGRVVTAPTNGAAGVIPAVLHFYMSFVPGSDLAGVHRFLLTAGAVGVLYKRKASISGAEMGCQGEVGVACSMAAAGLAAARGGSPEQVENAAEIGMEHNLGLTCDPVGGLVQIPCIERNAMGAVKAINAANLARRGDGIHSVSLDQVIATMRQTGLDMATHYKETSLGGLAVNVPEC